MKIGRSLNELAKELERQKETMKDYIAPTAELQMVMVANEAKLPYPKLRVNGHGVFNVNDIGHEQMASRLGIPQKYYDRMRESAPSLLSCNVNTWFQQQPEKRMVRTLDGNVRAFLSDRYRPLDNFPLAEVALNTLLDYQKGIKIESCEVTERRLYIKAITEKITAEVSKGDIVQAGIVISNSEVGCGSLKVEPLVYRLICTNGMIANDHAMKKYHVGRAGGEGDLAQEFYRDETRKADDRAFWLKVRDVIAGSFRQDVFDSLINKMRVAAAKDITGSVEKAVEVSASQFGFNESESSGILRHLIKGGELTQWGLVNAITRTAQDVSAYDRATDLERIGGTVLELPNTQWREIAEAA